MSESLDSADAKKPLPPLKGGVEAVEIQHEGRPMILLRDGEGLVEKPMAVSMAGFMIASMLNGQNSASDIQAVFNKESGSDLKPQEIENMVVQFEKAGYLETEDLQKKRLTVLQEFKENPVRKPHFVNVGYPSESMELATFLGKFFKDPKGPGKEFVSAQEGTCPPLGLMSPHIDLERGGPTYAWGYQALSETQPPDVILALGVSHMTTNSPWVLTPKKFDTPYGEVPLDEDLYKKINGALWYEGRADEWVHRTEHSLEFQALWLKYLWREKTPAWVPVLCSSFEGYCSDKAPSSISTVEEAVKKIGGILKDLQDQGKKVLVLAGIDLAHVGPRFGDKIKIEDEMKKNLEKEDRASLDIAMKGDADAFYMNVVKGGNPRHWCGMSVIYTFLRLMKILSPEKPVPGNLLAYNQAEDPMGGVVSFVSAVYPKPK